MAVPYTAGAKLDNSYCTMTDSGDSVKPVRDRTLCSGQYEGVTTVAIYTTDDRLRKTVWIRGVTHSAF